jgi:translation initiation factor 4B
MGDWTRKGPLDGPPARMGRQPSDFGERRPPRDRDLAAEPKPQRDFNWERKGPLSPLPQQEAPRGPPEGLGERSESQRGNRRQSPATWGEGRPEGSRPPRREPTDRPERPERPERAPTAAEKDMQWRDRMRPDAPVKSPEPAQDVSTPASPVPSAAAPATGGRPKLNLAKRTVSEAPEVASPSAASDSKASPFGAARPINTAAREKEIEEKRLQAIQEKKEADEKAKEERRLAKEAAAAEAAAAKEAAETEEAPKEEESAEPAAEAPAEGEAPKEDAEQQNGTAETKVPIRNKEPKENPNPKSRAFDTGNWRSASNEQRGPRGPARGGRGGGRGGHDRGDERRNSRQEGRGPRPNGPPRPQQEGDEGQTQDDDGWTTVPKKGRQGKPLVS